MSSAEDPEYFGRRNKVNSFSRTWGLLNNINTPWFIAYAALGAVAFMMLILWIGLQDFKEKIAAINPVAFQDCVDQVAQLQPAAGYKSITCNPDGSLTVVVSEK